MNFVLTIGMHFIEVNSHRWVNKRLGKTGDKLTMPSLWINTLGSEDPRPIAIYFAL